MPMHDWTRVKAGTYHNFHILWMSTLTNRLNSGILPAGYFAMAEQIVGNPETDVVALQRGERTNSSSPDNGGVTTAPPRPQTRIVLPIPDKDRYASKAARVAIHHDLGEVVAVIELVSPGNKDRRHSRDTFVAKAIDLLRQQVNLLIIDPFPPGKHDPQGIQKEICDDFTDQPDLPPDKQLTVGAYQAGPVRTAFIELFAVGDRLPNMPLFLFNEHYVLVPLEETYQTTWNVLPVELRQLLEPPASA